MMSPFSTSVSCTLISLTVVPLVLLKSVSIQRPFFHSMTACFAEQNSSVRSTSEEGSLPRVVLARRGWLSPSVRDTNLACEDGLEDRPPSVSRISSLDIVQTRANRRARNTRLSDRPITLNLSVVALFAFEHKAKLTDGYLVSDAQLLGGHSRAIYHGPIGALKVFDDDAAILELDLSMLS